MSNVVDLRALPIARYETPGLAAAECLLSMARAVVYLHINSRHKAKIHTDY